MYIYLPIAEQPINAFIVLGVGWLIGIIMGMVGIGGGFLLTPLMIFFGITWKDENILSPIEEKAMC